MVARSDMSLASVLSPSCRVSAPWARCSLSTSHHHIPAPELILIRDHVDGKPKGMNTLRCHPTSESSKGSKGVGNRPLLLLGGTSQVIPSWIGHTQHLALHRPLILPELRGQGCTTELDVSDCSLPSQVQDIIALLDACPDFEGPVDVCGFSFGGRVALALAAEHPERVGRLVLTGVSADRGALGRIILQSWKSILQSECPDDTATLQAMLWTSVTDVHDPSFLTRHEGKFKEWIHSATLHNTRAGIRAIVEQTHTDDPSDPWHPQNMIERLPDSLIHNTLCIYSKFDRVAPYQHRLRRSGLEVHQHSSGGHMLPLEEPGGWRRLVTRFLEGVKLS